MTRAPKISIVMAVYNGLPSLQDALASIFSQSFTDFELILIDDGSSDGSRQFLESLHDSRLRLTSNSENLGLSSSLNRGFDLAGGEYIARMDHDDISLSKRFARQIEFLDKHQQVDVLGTAARTIGVNPSQVWRHPSDDAAIRSAMLFYNPLIHASLMLRRASFNAKDLRYDPDIAYAQDYELWGRAAAHLRFANLEEVLIEYRLHSGQTGRLHGHEQAQTAMLVHRRQLLRLDLNFNEDDLLLHTAVGRSEFNGVAKDLDHVEHWLMRLSAANTQTGIYPSKTFAQELERHWWAACRNAIDQGLSAWQRYLASPIAQDGTRGILERRVFWLKALMRQWGLR